MSSAKYNEDDELDTCVDKARELLHNSALPRYHRIRTLALQGSVVGHDCPSSSLNKCSPSHSNWCEDRRCCVEVDFLWRFIRRLHPAGENEKNNQSMDELRDYILELRAVLDEEQAKAADGGDVDDDEAPIQSRLVDYELQLAEEKALAEDENNDPEALLAEIPKP